jgi:UDP-N-acetylmuramyl tripeptide synthase
MFNIRKTAAILVGKIIINLSRLLGNQGSTLPGKLASRIYPPLLRELGGNTYKDTFIVTGTNGKTTTTNMIAAIIREKGSSYVHNQAGANMLAGITTAYLSQTNIRGTRAIDYALLETDEANVPLLVKLIKPRYLVITNFFRDQLDRYGELDYTISLIKQAVRDSDVEMLLNADDPLESNFAAETGRICWYYGFGDTEYDTYFGAESREGRYCVFCGRELHYARFHYAQLGVYHCPQCGNQNPPPDFGGSELKLTPRLHLKVKDIVLESPYQGFYNAYNILAAASLASLSGFEPEIIQRAIAGFHPEAGRMETFNIKGKRVVLILVKNPTGLNQSLSMVLQDNTCKNLFIALNDNAADGRDVSWIWDADLEFINGEENRINRIICSGQRSGDMAIRIKYTGVNTEKITIEPELQSGIEQALDLESDVSYILCTYTALFASRKILVKLQKKYGKTETRNSADLYEQRGQNGER